MLKRIRKNKKGFTLAELLIVVAIIGVLVAISIPIFTAQLGKARAATDAANIRSGYAEVASTVLTDNVTTDKTYTLEADGTVKETSTSAYKTKGKSADLGTETTVIGSTKVGTGTGELNWEANKSITYTYDADTGTITISAS